MYTVVKMILVLLVKKSLIYPLRPQDVLLGPLNSRIRHQNFAYKSHHHHNHMFVMELGHLLIRSGLTYPEVSSKVYHDSCCQLGGNVSLPWVICFEAFYLYVVSFHETYQWLKFPLNGLQAQSRVKSSGMIATFSLKNVYNQIPSNAELYPK